MSDDLGVRRRRSYSIISVTKTYIIDPRHAVENSFENFIIVYKEVVVDVEKDEEVVEESKHNAGLEMRNGKAGLYGRGLDWMLVVSELTGDGQMVIRRFIFYYGPRAVNLFDLYLSIDSDDRVFVADTGLSRPI